MEIRLFQYSTPSRSYFLYPTTISNSHPLFPPSLVTLMMIAAASPLSLGASKCQLCYAHGLCYSTSYGINCSCIKPPIDTRRASDLSSISFRNRSPFFGSTKFQWSTVERDLCLLKVSVAADYSDSVPDSFPDSSNTRSCQGYHPLEEVKVNEGIRDTQLTSAEIARTTVEANSSALLVFPGTVHCEPHKQISWAEFQYIVDDYGDIYFEIFYDRNILENPEAINPVNALIGMDIQMYDNQRVANKSNVFTIGSGDDIPFNDDYFKVMDSGVSDGPVDWGMPSSSSWIHPIYFANCLTKAVNTEYSRKMEHPSNGVSIMGCLRPVFDDEEPYLRRLFRVEDSDDDNTDWKDGEIVGFSSKNEESRTSSAIYRLEITRVELFSVYGIQAAISLQDFQDAEPDFLVYHSSAILDRFNEKGISGSVALKALSKKKGLHVEGTKLIGVDSLGIDVRIFSGKEVQTHRFPFKAQATFEVAAEKEISRLLFPRSHRKKYRSHYESHDDGFREYKSF